MSLWNLRCPENQDEAVINYNYLIIAYLFNYELIIMKII